MCATRLHRKRTRVGDLQVQLYRDYIGPVLGHVRLKAVTPQTVKKVLNEMAQKGKSTQTRKHVFGVMRKMFSDAIEFYQYLIFNPVLKKLNPDVPVVEAPHLRNLEQIKKLLLVVEGKHYELAVWSQIYAGLRVGEIIALRWEDVDLEAETLVVRRTYVRMLLCIRDYPKGKKQFTITLPPELWEKLVKAKEKVVNEFVVNSMAGTMLNYKTYLKGLREHCEELGITKLGTHGLRHTTSSLYLKHGASKDDMRELFSHSSGAVTERYVHGQGGNLEKVANEMRLFGEQKPTQPRPRFSGPNKNRTKLVLIRSN